VGSQKRLKMKRSKSAGQSRAKRGSILSKTLPEYLQGINQVHKGQTDVQDSFASESFSFESNPASE
jgi:hypothetical protein